GGYDEPEILPPQNPSICLKGLDGEHTQYAVANTFAFWGPSILKGSGVANVWYLGLLNAVPFVAGVVMMTTVAWRSDKKMERRWHAAFGQALSVVGLMLLPAGVHDPLLAVVSLALVASGHYAFWSVFWDDSSELLPCPLGAGRHRARSEHRSSRRHLRVELHGHDQRCHG
ncbi:hypothetical protein AAFX91_30425, partial [Bradyrhizobium sp. 31Argb]